MECQAVPAFGGGADDNTVALLIGGPFGVQPQPKRHLGHPAGGWGLAQAGGGGGGETASVFSCRDSGGQGTHVVAARPIAWAIGKQKPQNWCPGCPGSGPWDSPPRQQLRTATNSAQCKRASTTQTRGIMQLHPTGAYRKPLAPIGNCTTELDGAPNAQTRPLVTLRHGRCWALWGHCGAVAPPRLHRRCACNASRAGKSQGGTLGAYPQRSPDRRGPILWGADLGEWEIASGTPVIRSGVGEKKGVGTGSESTHTHPPFKTAAPGALGGGGGGGVTIEKVTGGQLCLQNDDFWEGLPSAVTRLGYATRIPPNAEGGVCGSHACA